ncbi:hypothetical protein T552_00717 [Pneumocystis carinii B80]|uniref:CMP/dCMP-type deaminase domain-containing protein n=1 Tax=Pneumocystis carinii (strain B80) TaxID=1408658 RepID=A0A0W4ZPG7_PNEC8|nr:hypothetical protein T552_00717 [Pneumocystis carinii B80]KTW30240.1 hypothetical protein T552_00717 [Pneumocystis carinii B80]
MASKEQVCSDRAEKWPFYRVRSNLERRQLETVDVFVGRIKEKETKLIIKFIEECLPCETLDLSYLKRLRKINGNEGNNMLEVILHSTRGLSFEELEKKLKERSINMEVRIVQVSKYAPLTYEQFHAWKVLWPLHFRKNILKLAEFTDTTILKLKELMNHTWDLANKSKEIKIASIFVNMDLNVVVSSIDLRLSSKNPLKHSIINCITEIGKMLEKQGMLITKGFFYLCKDLIVITTHEPCVMCCMAMVHSRIFRIFYSINMPKTGGLESNYHIHGRNELNHRYEVYGGFIVENMQFIIDEKIHV